MDSQPVEPDRGAALQPSFAIGPNRLALDEALTKLERENLEAANLAKLRLFTGLTVDEAADALRISRRTGFRLWTYARAFLQAELSADDPSAPA